MRTRGPAQAVAFTWKKGVLRAGSDFLLALGRAQGRLTSSWPWDGEAEKQRRGPYRVCELQLPGLCLKHDVQTAALEVCAVGGAGDLEGE